MTPMPLVLSLLLQRLRRGSKARRRFLMMNLAELDPLPLGPGWFDSSWELEMGLEVCEGSDAELHPLFESMLHEPAVASPTRVVPGAQNLIEIELADRGSWPLPARPRHAPSQRAELELALV